MTEVSSPAPSLPTARGRCPFDPPPELGRLREEAPISRLSYPDGLDGWLVTGHATARAVLTDARFSARQDLRYSPVRARPMPVIPPATPGIFLGMDPPEHTGYRRALAKLFSPHRVELLTPMIERVVAEHVEALRRHGPPADLVALLATPVPVVVSCTLLGIAAADVPRVHEAAVLRDDFRLSEDERAVASERIYECARDLVRAEPAGGIVASLLADGLTRTEVTLIAYLLLITGQEPMANMLAYGVYALLCHPGQWAALREDPALIGGAVDELLRYLTVAQHGTVRTALTDVDLDGHLIRAGEPVTVSLAAANRDPAWYPDPDTLDITRKPRGHLAFGHGVHHCLGYELARTQLRVCYRALVAAFPALRLAVAPEDVPLRDDRDAYGVYELPVSW